MGQRLYHRRWPSHLQDDYAMEDLREKNQHRTYRPKPRDREHARRICSPCGSGLWSILIEPHSICRPGSGDERFFQKGCSIRGRFFTGPDGIEYRWRLGVHVPELFLNDGIDTPVACYHRSSLGILSPAHAAYLEIFPVGEHMVDLIVVTFIYMERLRQEEEAQRTRGGGGS